MPSRPESASTSTIMRIVFHGENAASFSRDFQRLLGEGAQISVLPDVLTDPAHSQTYAAGDVIIGVRFSGDLPTPRQLQLFHVPGAGYDAVNLDAIPIQPSCAIALATNTLSRNM
jgi:hypothetical protein